MTLNTGGHVSQPLLPDNPEKPSTPHRKWSTHVFPPQAGPCLPATSLRSNANTDLGRTQEPKIPPWPPVLWPDFSPIYNVSKIWLGPNRTLDLHLVTACGLKYQTPLHGYLGALHVTPDCGVGASRWVLQPLPGYLTPCSRDHFLLGKGHPGVRYGSLPHPLPVRGYPPRRLSHPLPAHGFSVPAHPRSWLPSPGALLLSPPHCLTTHAGVKAARHSGSTSSCHHVLYTHTLLHQSHIQLPPPPPPQCVGTGAGHRVKQQHESTQQHGLLIRYIPIHGCTHARILHTSTRGYGFNHHNACYTHYAQKIKYEEKIQKKKKKKNPQINDITQMYSHSGLESICIMDVSC